MSQSIDAIVLKKCSKCGAEKALSAYNKHSGSKDGLRGYCKACHVASSTKWIHENREKYNKRIRDDRAKNPDKYKAWSKAYQESDPEHFRRVKNAWVENNKEKRAVISKKYAASHAEKILASVRKRQSKKLQAFPLWADEKRIRDIYAQAKAMMALTGEPYDVDHIVPLQGKTVCGLHCEANLQVIPRSDNRKKSNRYWPDMP